MELVAYSYSPSQITDLELHFLRVRVDFEAPVAFTTCFFPPTVVLQVLACFPSLSDHIVVYLADCDHSTKDYLVTIVNRRQA